MRLSSLLLFAVMGFPSKESGAGGSGVLSNPPWTQAALAAQTVNLDGVGDIKASALNATTDIIAYRNENVFNPDQYASVIIRGGLASGVNYAEVFVRCSGSGGTFACYQFLTDGVTGAGHTELWKYGAGSGTLLTNFATTFVTGDVMRISVVGPLITCWKNNAVVGTFSDASVAIGAPGIGVFNSAANNLILQNFEGGNVAEAYSIGTRRIGPVNRGPFDRLGFLKRSDGAAPAPAVGGTVTIATDVGSLVLDGFAPTIGTPVTVTPDVGSLVLAGNAPTFPTTLTPGFGQLSFTGFAPVLGVPVTVVPGFGQITLTGLAPTFPRTIVPGTGALILSGFAATFPQTLLPGSGAALLNGFAPSFSFVAGSFTLQPGLGALILAGFAPTLGLPQTLVPGAGQLSLSGFSPTIGAPVTVTPGLGALAITGLSPLFPRTITAGTGVASLAGFSPTLGLPVTLRPDVGQLVLIGFDPIVQGSPVVSLVVPTGKYKPEHDSAVVDLGAAHGFAAEHTGAVTDVGNAQGFSSEHSSALKDLGDAGV